MSIQAFASGSHQMYTVTEPGHREKKTATKEDKIHTLVLPAYFLGTCTVSRLGMYMCVCVGTVQEINQPMGY